jgi:hypothetical protein
MPIVPRTPDEIRQSLIAYMVSTGVLTSIDEGDVASTIFGAFAEGLSALEHKLLNFVRNHLLDVSGELLDDRVAQIPNVPPRRAPMPAHGGDVTLTKDPALADVSFEPGSIRICNANAPSIVYVNRDAVSMDEFTSSVTGVYFIALTTGPSTNAPAGTLNLILSGTGLLTCINSTALTGGSAREDDSFLRQRAMAMIMSLARSQASAIEALALNFTDSNNTTILHAKAFEYADSQRGYTELVVSDAQGMSGATRLAAQSTGVIPDLPVGSRHTFWFDAPAANRLSISIQTPPEYTQRTYTAPLDWWIPIEEKGVGWSQRPTDFLIPGAIWSIEGHLVYQGWISEFQEFVNRTCAAAGTRVRVVKADAQMITLRANCIFAAGRLASEVFAIVKDYIVEFFNRLAPGEPAFIHKLHDWVAQVPGVVNIIFEQEDLYPGSPRSKLVTTASNITLY